MCDQRGKYTYLYNYMYIYYVTDKGEQSNK